MPLQPCMHRLDPNPKPNRNPNHNPLDGAKKLIISHARDMTGQLDGDATSSPTPPVSTGLLPPPTEDSSPSPADNVQLELTPSVSSHPSHLRITASVTAGPGRHPSPPKTSTSSPQPTRLHPQQVPTPGDISTPRDQEQPQPQPQTPKALTQDKVIARPLLKSRRKGKNLPDACLGMTDLAVEDNKDGKHQDTSDDPLIRAPDQSLFLTTLLPSVLKLTQRVHNTTTKDTNTEQPQGVYPHEKTSKKNTQKIMPLTHKNI